ncbi:mucin-19-like [Paramacrobiotus metropolitanus]|uniref:mucin-19-like n=1 Tax=Paramacrobiotus metropolitanus TaxID=2943436 RepID=UPI002446262C|nr:mucin-19-like [Paramacrobiotus metropolitanus]
MTSGPLSSISNVISESSDSADHRDDFMAAVDRCHSTIRTQVLERSDEVANFFVNACHKLDIDHPHDYLSYIDNNVLNIQSFVKTQFLQLQNDIRYLRGAPNEELPSAVEKKLSRLLSQSHNSYAAFRDTLSNQGLSQRDQSVLLPGGNSNLTTTPSELPSDTIPGDTEASANSAEPIFSARGSQSLGGASPRSKESSGSALPRNQSDANPRSSVTNQPISDVTVLEQYSTIERRNSFPSRNQYRDSQQSRSSTTQSLDSAGSLPRRASTQSISSTDSTSRVKITVPRESISSPVPDEGGQRSRISVPTEESIPSRQSRTSTSSLPSESHAVQEAISETSQPFDDSPSYPRRSSKQDPNSHTSGSRPSIASTLSEPAKQSRQSVDGASRRKSTISDETCPDEDISRTDTSCEPETLPSLGSLPRKKSSAKSSVIDEMPTKGSPQRALRERRSTRRSLHSQRSDPLQGSSSSSSSCEEEAISRQSIQGPPGSRTSIEHRTSDKGPYIHVHSRIEHPQSRVYKSFSRDSEENALHQPSKASSDSRGSVPSTNLNSRQGMHKTSANHGSAKGASREPQQETQKKGAHKKESLLSLRSHRSPKKRHAAASKTSVVSSAGDSGASEEKMVNNSRSTRHRPSVNRSIPRSALTNRSSLRSHGGTTGRTGSSTTIHTVPPEHHSQSDTIQTKTPSSVTFKIAHSQSRSPSRSRLNTTPSARTTSSGGSKPSTRSARSEITQVPSDTSQVSGKPSGLGSRYSKTSGNSRLRKPSASYGSSMSNASRKSERSKFQPAGSEKSLLVHMTASHSSQRSGRTSRSPASQRSRSYHSTRTAFSKEPSSSRHSAVSSAPKSIATRATERSIDRREKDQYSARLTPSNSRFTVEHTVSHEPSEIESKVYTKASDLSHRTERSGRADRPLESSAQFSHRTGRSQNSGRSAAPIGNRSDRSEIQRPESRHSGKSAATRPTASRHTDRSDLSKHSIRTTTTASGRTRHSDRSSELSTATSPSKHTARSDPSKHSIRTTTTASGRTRHSDRPSETSVSAAPSKHTDRSDLSQHSVRTTTTASGRTRHSDRPSELSISATPSGHSVRSLHPVRTSSHVSRLSDRSGKFQPVSSRSGHSVRSISPARTASDMSRHSDRPSKSTLRSVPSSAYDMGPSVSVESLRSTSSRNRASSPNGSGVIAVSSHSSERSFYSEVHSIHSEIERSASGTSFPAPSNIPSRLQPDLLHPNMAYGMKPGMSRTSNIHSTASHMSPKHSQFSWTYSGASGGSSRSGESGESDDQSEEYSHTSLANKSSAHSQLSTRSQQSQTESEYTGTDGAVESDNSIASDASDYSLAARKKKRKKKQNER